MLYRKEIDGLRAVAVASVVLFHADFTWIKGGFIGVDIFFVISGYLITTIIIKELDEKTFSIASFYERRARRILPALFVMLLCVAPIAYFTLLPDQLERLSKSAISSLLFTSNYFFWIHTEYFGPQSNQEPLLHTWSLAVEEQYYLLFPLAATLIWKLCVGFKKGALYRLRYAFFIALILIAVTLSLAYSEVWVRLSGSPRLFYDTIARVWELLFGSLCATYLSRYRKSDPPRLIAETCSLLGFALIVGSCLRIDESPYPSRFAPIAAIGAVLVILFVSPYTTIARTLGSKWLVGVGLISYSLYLWHWIIFAFARIYGVQSAGAFLSLIALSLAIAYLSWRYIEKPFRNQAFLSRKQVFALSFAGAALIGVVGGGGAISKGAPWRFNTDEIDLFTTLSARTNYVTNRYDAPYKRIGFSDDNRTKVLIIGDSFSQDFYNIILEAGFFGDAEFCASYVAAICQVYRGEEDPFAFIDKANKPLCEARVYNDRFVSLQDRLLSRADIVIFAANWAKWSAERLTRTIDNMRIAQTTTIIVIGSKNFGAIDVKNYLDIPLKERSLLRNEVSAGYLESNAIMKEAFANQTRVKFIDLRAALCGEESSSCPIFTPEGLLISYDGAHLTEAGAKHIGSLLANNPTFAPFKAQNR
ncbi:MAG: acyltransferase [Helicobacteraceae bacterium]|jgi:peptidoglycan/LPS O-acetylase OafA/YrhL|nr:acyltransferase [Helicobacteraceae bacterium]